MPITSIQPIPHEPALFIKKMKTLILADLHIGIETDFREKGVRTASHTQHLTNRILQLIHQYHPHDTYLLGDIKHSIPGLPSHERYDVKHFLASIKEHTTVHILPGNHDGSITSLISPDIHLHPSDGYQLETIGLIHGHRWPQEHLLSTEHLILGHTHPTIMLTDRIGYKTYEPCWVYTRLISETLTQRYPSIQSPYIIILPAYNPLCGGIAINQDRLIGPLFKHLDIPNADIYLLDGSHLGKVKDLR